MNDFYNKCYIYPNTRIESSAPIVTEIQTFEILDYQIVHPDTGINNKPAHQFTYRKHGNPETKNIIISGEQVHNYKNIIKNNLNSGNPYILETFEL